MTAMFLFSIARLHAAPCVGGARNGRRPPDLARVGAGMVARSCSLLPEASALEIHGAGGGRSVVRLSNTGVRACAASTATFMASSTRISFTGLAWMTSFTDQAELDQILACDDRNK